MKGWVKPAFFHIWGTFVKVLFVHRKGIFRFKGGEQDQIVNTKNALERIGLTIDLVDTIDTSRVAEYDIIHFFGLDASHIQEIKATSNAPKVLTPVFWDRAQGYLFDTEFERWLRPGRELLDNLLYFLSDISGNRNRRIAKVCRTHFYKMLHKYAQFQSVIDDIQLFLPNSESEMNALRTFYVMSSPPLYRIVPNAVNLQALDVMSDYSHKHLPKDTPFICCSGGIDRRKNQFSLVRAMVGIDVPLVIAGVMRDRRYTQAVHRAASHTANTIFTGHLEQPDLQSVYETAAVHVLPSFHDTPGIASLEAVAHKCVNVGTQIGGLREYLGDYSLYCNPFSVEHIHEQIVKALNQPPNVEGSALVRSKYTYEQAAEATLNGYRILLDGA